MKPSLFISKGEWQTDLPIEKFAESGIHLELKVGEDSAKLVAGHFNGYSQFVILSPAGNHVPMGATLPVKSFVMQKLCRILEPVIKDASQDEAFYRLSVGARGVEGLPDQAKKIAQYMNMKVMDYTTGLLSDIFFVDYSYELDCNFVCWHCESNHLNEDSLRELTDFIHTTLDDIENDEDILEEE